MRIFHMPVNQNQFIKFLYNRCGNILAADFKIIGRIVFPDFECIIHPIITMIESQKAYSLINLT